MINIMLSDQFYDLLGLVSLQRLLQDASTWKAATTLLALVLIGVIVDYARMLWLRSKMVRMRVASLSPFD